MALVPVAHPVPVRLIPPRSRKERVAYDLRRVSAEIPEADASAFRALGTMPNGLTLSERDGAAWMRLETQPGPTPVTRAAFLDFLASDAEPGHVLRQHFMRTPLVAGIAVHVPGRLGKVDADRGEFDAAKGRVLEDFGPAAERALRAFLERDVALVADAVFVRVPGPLAGQFTSWESPTLFPSALPRAEALTGNFCRPADAEAFQAIQARDGLPEWRLNRPRILDGAGFPEMPAGIEGDADLHLLACCLPETLLPLVERAYRGIPELVPGLRTRAILGRIGVVPGDDPAAALREMRGAIDALKAKGGYHSPQADFARDFIDEVLAARIAPAPGADAEDLAGLAPG